MPIITNTDDDINDAISTMIKSDNQFNVDNNAKLANDKGGVL